MTNEDYQKIFHEIKNNVTFISSSLQLIEKQHPEIISFSYWKDTVQEVTALKNMLIDLASARLCNDLDLQNVSPNVIFPKMISSCLTLFHTDDFHCETKISPALPNVRIDSKRLKRALYNLIKNSYEAMDGSGLIHIVISQRDAFICIELTDCGGGIPLDYLPKLFTPFETTKSTGTGLGLLITRQIIDAHGGRLTVDSRPKLGCTFSIYLPVHKA